MLCFFSSRAHRQRADRLIRFAQNSICCCFAKVMLFIACLVVLSASEALAQAEAAKGQFRPLGCGANSRTQQGNFEYVGVTVFEPDLELARKDAKKACEPIVANVRDLINATTAEIAALKCPEECSVRESRTNSDGTYFTAPGRYSAWDNLFDFSHYFYRRKLKKARDNGECGETNEDKELCEWHILMGDLMFFSCFGGWQVESVIVCSEGLSVESGDMELSEATVGAVVTAGFGTNE